MEDEIKKEEGTEKEEEQTAEKPLNKMTVKELREIAKDIPGVAGVHAMKKEEVLALIKKERGIEDELPVEKRKKKAKSTLNVKDLKKKILHLKGQKETAREEKDRKRIEVLRRRINRLKKQTRKVAQG